MQSTYTHATNLSPMPALLNRALIIQDNSHWARAVLSYLTYVENPLLDNLPAHEQLSSRMISDTTVAIFRFKPKQSK